MCLGLCQSCIGGTIGISGSDQLSFQFSNRVIPYCILLLAGSEAE